ncbi:MAG TPA: helix-turn-helix domain-containing protein [Pyrinomonadaceae bacterium]
MSTNQIETVESTRTVGHSYVFGRFELTVSENGNTTLSSGGHPVALTTVALTILRVLVENHGRYVTTKQLLDNASQSPDATENMVHGAVHELRRTLNDASLIKTERLKGYCFTGEVSEHPNAAPDITASELNAVIVDQSVDQDIWTETPSDTRRDPFVVVALLVSAAVLLLPFGLAFASDSWANVTKQLGFIQALMILVGLGYDFYLSDSRDFKRVDTEHQRAFIAAQQFRRSWRLLLASWCSLYFALLLSLRFAPAAGINPSREWQALQVINTSLNNASILALVLCYVVLNRPTVVAVAGREVEDLPFKRGLIVVGAFGLLEAILVVLFESRGHADYAGAVLFGADVLSGVGGGIAMALFISRLDSRLLSTSGLLPIIPIVLYFYAVIQPFYPLLNWTFPGRAGLPPHVDLWILQLAFMLKSVMYIYVTDRFKKERFLFYMINARRFYEDVDTKWRRFKSV